LTKLLQIGSNGFYRKMRLTSRDQTVSQITAELYERICPLDKSDRRIPLALNNKLRSTLNGVIERNHRNSKLTQ
jgi:hypothetical protein